ncbi:unnamed protein product [Schistosoma turkestanicum]|nr:unnamed protein product [Schistosoma turkestanicum]
MSTNVPAELSDAQMYRPPPGYTSYRTTKFLEDSVYSSKKQPNGSGAMEQIDVSELSKVIKSNLLKDLHTKQTIIEAFMFQLLKSMKKFKAIEHSKSKSVTINDESYSKLIRMTQSLLSEKQNLRRKTDILKEDLTILNDEYLNTRKLLDGLTLEHMTLWKHIIQLKRDLEDKIIQVENLLRIKSILQQYYEIYAILKIHEENQKNELNQVKFKNANLESLSKELGMSSGTVIQECENLKLNNVQLKQQIQRRYEEEINLRVRIEQLTHENKILKHELTQNQVEQINNSSPSNEITKICENFQALQREYYQLQQLFTEENEKRRLLHNQLQEVSGNVKVLCRCRPATKSNNPCILKFKSIDRIILPIVNVHQRHTHLKSTRKHTVNEYVFKFNRVFRPEAKQLDVFEEIQPFITSCIDGHNVCIMAYGLKASGKTYTIQGSVNDPGIALRSITKLFELCRSLQIIWTTQISIAMLAIHNEIIYDLLSEKTKQVKLSDESIDVRLIEMEEKIAANEHDMIYWITKGNIQHKLISNTPDIEPSRAHCIIRLQITLYDAFNKTERNSSLILCDLAGSESAERNKTNCDARVEIEYVNKSLATLARVFEALRRLNHSLKSGEHNANLITVPYHDSKLTQLLKPYLGGQAKFILIITIFDEPKLIDHIIKALKLGKKAMRISLGPTSPNRTILTSSFREPEVEKS